MPSYIQQRVVSEDLAHAMQDAKEALLNAVEMRDWKGVKKYADQLAKMDRDKYDQDHEKEKSTYVSPWANAKAQLAAQQKKK